MIFEIEINGIVKETHEYESSDANDIISQLMNDQDLYCLLRMGPQFDEDVSQLQEFIDKYENEELTFDDIKSLNLELSIGSIRCVGYKE